MKGLNIQAVQIYPPLGEVADGTRSEFNVLTSSAYEVPLQHHHLLCGDGIRQTEALLPDCNDLKL